MCSRHRALRRVGSEQTHRRSIPCRAVLAQLRSQIGNLLLRVGSRRLGTWKLGENAVELSLPLIALRSQVVLALLRVVQPIQCVVIVGLQLSEGIFPVLEGYRVDIVGNACTVFNASHGTVLCYPGPVLRWV